MSIPSLLAFSDGLAEVVSRLAPAIVQVAGRRRPSSGLAFGPDLVLTTARALGPEDGLRVTRDDGRACDAEVAGWDPASGIVLLRAQGLDAAIARAAPAPARVGQIGVALGRSWSNQITATLGLVSVIGGPLPTGPGRAIDRVIRTSAPMHPGFAGGALADANGDVLGLATAASIRGLAVVIPSDIAWSVAQRLAEHGTVPRGYLGLAGQAVSLPERQRTDGHDAALLVVGIAPGSPADGSGMLVGDLVVAFDGRAVRSPIDLLELLQGDRVGRTVPVDLIRGEQRLTVSIRIGARAER